MWIKSLNLWDLRKLWDKKGKLFSKLSIIRNRFWDEYLQSDKFKVLLGDIRKWNSDKVFKVFNDYISFNTIISGLENEISRFNNWLRIVYWWEGDRNYLLSKLNNLKINFPQYFEILNELELRLKDITPMLSEESFQDQITKIENEISRLEKWNAIIAWWEGDRTYLLWKLNELREKSLGNSEIISQLELRLKNVDVNLSSYENRSNGVNLFWSRGSDFPEWYLQALWMLSNYSNSIKISKDEVIKIAQELWLQDWIYTFDRWWNICYVVIKSNFDISLFHPPSYDISYLMRSFRTLKYLWVKKI